MRVNNNRDLSMTVHEKGDSRVGLRINVRKEPPAHWQNLIFSVKLVGRTAVSLQLKHEEGLVAQNDYGSTN